MNTLKTLVLCHCIVAAGLACGGAEPSLANQRLAITFERIIFELERLPSDVRIELVRVARSSPHPTEDALRFDSTAAIRVLLNPNSYRGDTIGIFRGLADAQWKPDGKSLPGLAKLRVRILAPWNEVILELYIREQWSTIYFNGQWYSLEPKVIQTFIKSLSDWAIDSLQEDRSSG